MSTYRRNQECRRKAAYVTYDAASEEADRLAFGPDHKAVMPYVCRWCGSWHIGHAPRLRLIQRVRVKQ